MKATAKQLFFELIVVIAGILIAFYVDDYTSGLSEQEVFEQTCQTLKLEIEANSRELREHLDGHEKLRDYSWEESKLDSPVSVDEIMARVTAEHGGINDAAVRELIWKPFLNPERLSSHYELINTLAQIEEQSEVVKWQWRELIHYLYVNRSKQGKMAAKEVHVMAYDLCMEEELLVDLNNECLQQLEHALQ